MKKVNALSLFAIAALLVAAPVAAGFAQADPVPTVVGTATYDFTSATATWQPNQDLPSPLADVDVYRIFNTPIGGLASTDVNSIWGDRVTTIGTGLFDVFDMTLFNAAGGPILTAIVNVSFFDGATSSPLGSFNAGFNFGGGLPPGAGADLAITGASVLGINLNTTDLIITQKVVSFTGASNKFGVLLMTPPASIGAGSPAMYISSSTFGPAGFYTLAGVPESDPGYRVGILDPVPAKTKTWGSLKGQYR